MLRQAPGHRVAHGRQIGAPVMKDHPLRIARRAGGIVERYRLPFIGGAGPFKIRIAGLQKGFIFHLADQFPAFGKGVVNINDDRFDLGKGQRLPDQRRKLPVRQQQFALPMIEDEGQRRGIQPGVQRIQDGAGHGHAEMRLQHRRDVGGHHGDRIPLPDPPPDKRTRQTAGAGIELPVAVAEIAMDNGRLVRINGRRA